MIVILYSISYIFAPFFTLGRTHRDGFSFPSLFLFLALFSFCLRSFSAIRSRTFLEPFPFANRFRFSKRKSKLRISMKIYTSNKKNIFCFIVGMEIYHNLKRKKNSLKTVHEAVHERFLVIETMRSGSYCSSGTHCAMRSHLSFQKHR